MLRRTLWLAAVLSACGAPEPGDRDDDFDGELRDGQPAMLQAPDAQHAVTFERDTNERASGVRIRDEKHKKPKVIYSVHMVDLAAGEELRLRAEVTLSRCNDKDIAGQSGDAATTPCNSKDMKKDPYGYDPRFSAAFVLAHAADSASGDQVSPWFDLTCTEAKHHCALAVPEVAVKNLPNAADQYLNLVVTADARGHNARKWDVMEVEKGHGGLYVTRMAPGAQNHAIQAASDKLLANKKMGVDQTEDEGDDTQVKRLLYQVKLEGLQPGDVVDADARMRAVLGGYSCEPLITGSLILTEDKDAREAKGPHDLRLTEKNGHNCSDHSNNGCKYEKSGAIRIKSGAPSTMFLSYVATALRSCAAPNGGDKWHIDGKDGLLKVNVRR